MQTQTSKWFEQHNWKLLFSVLWTGQAFSLLGSNLVSFALIWWVTVETDSATVLALTTFVALIPAVFLGPIAGTLVDRWNRRWVMIMADSLVALATVVLVILFAVDAAEVWHVFVILFIRSLGGSFHWPAMQASTSLMVPSEHLSRVAGLNQMLQGAMNVVAPPLGALLLEVLPMQGVLAIDTVTAGIAVSILLFVVTIPQPERDAVTDDQPQKTSVLQEFREGLRYVAGWPALLIILGMATMINFLFNPAFSLMPLLIKNYFDGGAKELGWMNAAWGIGVVAGGLALGAWGGFKRKLVTSMVGLIGMGTAVAVLGVTPASALLLALGAMLVAGFMNPITNGPLFAVVQAVVKPDMQGRVFTLITASATGTSLISLLIAGPVADVLGIQFWYIAAGAFCAVMGVTGFMIPALMHMEEQGAQAPAEAVDALPLGALAADAALDR